MAVNVGIPKSPFYFFHSYLFANFFHNITKMQCWFQLQVPSVFPASMEQ